MPQEQGEHSLNLKNRKKLTMTGVSEVISFDDASVVLHTGMGTLVVQGSELQLKTLTLEGGNVVVEGQVSSLVYEQAARSGGWWSRLFG